MSYKEEEGKIYNNEMQLQSERSFKYGNNPGANQVPVSGVKGRRHKNEKSSSVN